METILTQYYQSPYGELLLGSFGDKLCLCDWMLNEKRRVPPLISVYGRRCMPIMRKALRK